MYNQNPYYAPNNRPDVVDFYKKHPNYVEPGVNLLDKFLKPHPTFGEFNTKHGVKPQWPLHENYSNTETQLANNQIRTNIRGPK
jgi:hypothetical protein